MASRCFSGEITWRSSRLGINHRHLISGNTTCQHRRTLSSMSNFSLTHQYRVKHEVHENIRIDHKGMLSWYIGKYSCVSLFSNSSYFEPKTISLRFSHLLSAFSNYFPLRRVLNSVVQLYPNDKPTRSWWILNSKQHSQSLFRSYFRAVSRVILTICWYSLSPLYSLKTGTVRVK